MTLLSTIEASFVFQTCCPLHRLRNMHSSKITLDSCSDIIILNSKLDLIHHNGILMQLKKFLDFVWQIPHVQQKLISFTDPNISQLPNNDWCIQHSVERFNLRLNLSHNVKNVIISTSNPEFQALFTVAQGFRPGHQWELLPDQPEELKAVGFGDTSCRNLGSYQILYFAAAHKVLLKQEGSFSWELSGTQEVQPLWQERSCGKRLLEEASRQETQTETKVPVVQFQRKGWQRQEISVWWTW